MLKSTYKPSAGTPHLPPGWSEHRAPTGHTYYYNAATKQSTYRRPTEFRQPITNTQYFAEQDLPKTQLRSLDTPSFDGPSLVSAGTPQIPFYPRNHLQGRGSFKEGHNSEQEFFLKDRPKSKHAIPNCTPWLLIKTKLGRRFVYNPEKGESFWKFPADVIKGVVELDRIEREKKLKPELDENTQLSRFANKQAVPGEEHLLKTKGLRSSEPIIHEAHIIQGEDGEEYEEVEVTDDEYDSNPSKRPKIGDGDPDVPVEFNEDDIAFQLAAMGQDYGLDPGEYGDGQIDGLEEGTEGLPLTEDDAQALFKEMLDDYHVSPYTTWEKLVEAGQIVHDDRYLVLSNMKSRKDVWTEWSKGRIQNLKEQRESEEKKNPYMLYLIFLQKYASPKLYWPEFRRKYKKEPEIRDAKLSDKEREKLYRDYINRLKLPEGVLKSDLVTFLKSIPLYSLNRDTPLENLPSSITMDIRYISLRPSIRDPLMETYISSLPAAPTTTDNSFEDQEALSKERADRKRRERAMADRHMQVQEEKRKQKGALEFSKGVLREGEEEIAKAMKVGKESLRSYMESDQ